MELRLSSGEAITANRFESNVLTLHSPRAFAPGSPIAFETTSEESERRFEGRTIGCKRLDDATFEVRLRLINLRREDRQFLGESLAC